MSPPPFIVGQKSKWIFCSHNIACTSGECLPVTSLWRPAENRSQSMIRPERGRVGHYCDNAPVIQPRSNSQTRAIHLVFSVIGDNPVWPPQPPPPVRPLQLGVYCPPPCAGHSPNHTTEPTDILFVPNPSSHVS